MKRKLPFSACVILMLITALLTYQIVTVVDEAKYNKIIGEFTFSPADDPKLAEIKALVENEYVNDIDKDYLTTSLVYGYVFGLKDPHAAYYTKEQYTEKISELNGNLTGIGIRVFLQELDGSDTDQIVIFEVMEGSPAEAAGIKAGDIIYSVGGVLYSELGYEETVNRITGEAGSSVTFEVMRNKRVKEFTIERKLFESQLVSYKISDTNANVGYIRIYEFGTSAVAQFKRAVESLKTQGATRLVFDVRNNPGGELTTITSILDYLLPEGPIITLTDKSGESTVYTSDKNEVALPMAVLANGSTASAAELFTASLIDYNKAIFVGTKTYGKGTVQTTYELSDKSAVKFSTQHYLPPSGVSFDGIGLYPTDGYEISLTEEEQKNFYLLSEEDDPQLMAAINYLIQVK
ncbi:MAG: S41 family peptidase [Clostridia bacterium]|nr:S41 family peptidase [Clostridia bacterium]